MIECGGGQCGAVRLSADAAMACVNAGAPDHFIMFFQDMLDETLYESHIRDGFLRICIILMGV